MVEVRLLGSRYEVGDLLGYGGMAEVHRGRDVRLGRDVAVKMLRADLARDPAFQNRFRREAQSAASLNHPAVVAVYDTGEEHVNGAVVPYIVMEYVDGRTLRDVLAQEGRLLPARALEIVAEVLKALDYSHRNGIVHRDIKPGNVMLTRTGDVKVMDFGIARAVTASAVTMTQTAAVIGTAHYLSPEQARGEHVDARSDVYSTGCLLYELFTGSPPFTGDSPVAVAYQHVREDPLPPSRVNPELTSAMDAIVLKALAKNPANRYQSAGEMRADIERALAGRPVEAPSVMATETMVAAAPAPATTVFLRQPEPKRGRRVLGYLLLAAAAVAVFVVAVLVAKSLLTTSKGDVNTPDLVGLTQPQAAEVLASKGLRIGNVSDAFSSKPQGTVIKQVPQSPILLSKGDTVDITLSKGLEMVNVPPIVGSSQDSAASILKGYKLKVGTVDAVSPPHHEPAGQVLSTDPTPGASVPAGTAVNLTVSSGKSPVPDVRGKDVQEARDTLRKAGFDMTTQPGYDPTQAPNVVLDQRPAPGQQAAEGSAVTVLVNTPPSPSPSVSPSGTPSPGPSTSPSTSPSESPSPPPSPPPSP